MIPTSTAATPLVPDADEARRWLTDELSKPEYQAAQPTAFDLAMQAVRDWFAELLAGATGVPGPVLTLIVVVVVAALVVVAFLVFGLPRLRRARTAAVPLFDEGDLRDLAALRRAATAAAAAGDWPLAIEERFRAIVRGLVDRDLVHVHPGTTAGAFADAATRALPEDEIGIRAAAAGFEGVRYLGHPGDAAEYERITALETRLAAARPAEAPASADASLEAVR
ncbi:DUF4129 domain-containing protein [Agromyces sp. SYSU K20354]|uniref:DUF4129 domain-containing protein n=1 Tax=Agromyces cavernae TaxID=2898659 RepID=UPI001E5E88EB|nr:DUF4129 domain-containing protein [Agromyces cavernae]MCD2444017.1 DUF4129 domain-containing protein [Agromyces cavernae]